MHPASNQVAASVSKLDLSSADGRAGIRSLLNEIERRHPGMILEAAAKIELDRLSTVSAQGGR